MSSGSDVVNYGSGGWEDGRCLTFWSMDFSALVSGQVVIPFVLQFVIISFPGGCSGF